MSKIKKLSAGITSLMLAGAALAQGETGTTLEQLKAAAQTPGLSKNVVVGGESTPEKSLQERLQIAAEKIKIDDVVALPIHELKAMLSEGQITFVSSNGRYALRGELIDLWQNKTLDTMSQIRDSTERLSLARMDVPITELNTISLVSSQADAPVVTVFVDPKSPASLDVIKKAKTLVGAYTFHFVIVPALGEESVEISKRLSCVTDRAAAFKAFESERPDSAQVDPLCDMHVFTQTLVAADLMGVNGVPFLVAPNGTIGRGMPSNLKTWISEHSF